MQLIERAWGVAVHGAASVRARPDIVRVRFKVVRLEQTPSAAFAQASEAVRATREVLRQHGIPDGAVDRSRLGLRSQYNYQHKREFIGYQCEAAFSVESHGLDDVQQLLIDVVAAGANEIEGVSFDVSAKGEMRAEARRRAVAAARDKAALYAEAAGARLGPVLHIDDVDPERANPEAYRSRSSGESADADLAPGYVVVSAAVLVGYAITHD